MIEKLEGCYTALITPMLDGDGLTNPIDYDKLFQLIGDQLNAGVDGILVAGTTGQSATLIPEEQVELIHKVHQEYGNKTQFIAGAGSNSTREAIELSQAIEDKIGPTTLLHVTGYYNGPPQEGIQNHFTQVADSIKGNIILYNVPGRTVSNIEAKTAIALSKHPKIIGIKEASGDLAQVSYIYEETDSEDFRLVSGEDHLVHTISRLGGYGVISASANIAPKPFAELTQETLKQNYDKSWKIQKELLPLIKEAVFAAKNPIPLMYMFDTNVRSPLCSLKDAGEHLPNQVDRILSQYSPEYLGINIK